VVASYVVLEPNLGFGRQLILITSGTRAGDELVLFAQGVRGVPRLEEVLGEPVVGRTSEYHPEAVAERLMVSLLNRQQKSEWMSTQTFWVGTEFGRVQLGRLYNLTFQPRVGEAMRLCAIPGGHQSLPRCDTWTNLLLVLRGDPALFFKVANWQRGNGDWNRGPVPGFGCEEVSLDAERCERR
jgi:hypothetical protein